MKSIHFKSVGWLAILAVAVVFCSCHDLEQSYGFPKKVVLAGAGADTIVSGHELVWSIHIDDAEFDCNVEDDYVVWKNEWLKVGLQSPSKSIEISAGPNPTNKDRRIDIQLVFGQEYGIIHVIQRGNIEQ